MINLQLPETASVDLSFSQIQSASIPALTLRRGNLGISRCESMSFDVSFLEGADGVSIKQNGPGVSVMLAAPDFGTGLSIGINTGLSLTQEGPAVADELDVTRNLDSTLALTLRVDDPTGRLYLDRNQGTSVTLDAADAGGLLQLSSNVGLPLAPLQVGAAERLRILNDTGFSDDEADEWSAGLAPGFNSRPIDGNEP